ncbi:MAG: hypothetical protein Q8J78_06955 [Moraxellaceae bacterium]|nr:hypothetical protein [Moraxellaceae bacterium]
MRFLLVFLFSIPFSLTAQANESDALDNARASLDSKLADTRGVISVSVADCNNKPCLLVYVEEMEPAILKQIPQQIDGFPTEIREGSPVGF